MKTLVNAGETMLSRMMAIDSFFLFFQVDRFMEKKNKLKWQAFLCPSDVAELSVFKANIKFVYPKNERMHTNATNS